MQLLVAFAVGSVLTPLAARAGAAVGLVDRPRPDALKIHARPIPLSGGIAVVVATLAAVALVRWPPGLVVLAVVLTLALGLVDDLRPLPAWPRVALIAGMGGLLVAGGIYLGPKGAWAAAGTVFVTVATANAVNILDGQDGLVGGVGSIAALGLAGVALLFDAPHAAGLGLALAGGLAGFLVWNRPPAGVFLGNGGAYAVGVLLAILAADVTAEEGWRGLLAAGLCLAVFAFELTFSAIHRVRAGYLVGGDRLHTYDLLSRRWGDRTRVTLAFWALGAVAAGLGLVVAVLPLPAGAAVTALAAAAAGAGGVGLWRGRESRT